MTVQRATEKPPLRYSNVSADPSAQARDQEAGPEVLRDSILNRPKERREEPVSVWFYLWEVLGEQLIELSPPLTQPSRWPGFHRPQPKVDQGINRDDVSFFSRGHIYN